MVRHLFCSAVAGLAVVAASATDSAGTSTGGLHSLLVITVDDLRPQLNVSYGLDFMATPNIDRLANEGVTFLRAYCQMAVCSPSRNSFMSGRRPDTTQVWNFVGSFRDSNVGANWTTMPEYFVQNDFLTYGYGKLYHPQNPPNDDFPQSWTNDSFNSYYWGNQAPIGDAFECTNKSSVPSAHVVNTLEQWGSKSACFTLNDTAALNDHDVKDLPQADQAVEYDHRVATRESTDCSIAD